MSRLFDVEVRRTLSNLGGLDLKERLSGVNLNQFFELMTGAVEFSKGMDQLKKFMFYGLPTEGMGHVKAPQLPDLRDKIVERLAEKQSTDLVHCVLGLFSEAGELLEALMAYVFEGEELDRTNVVEELGDAAWYLSVGSQAAGTTMDELEALVTKKLRKRYPVGFTAKDCVDRDLSPEREILEEGIKKE